MAYQVLRVRPSGVLWGILRPLLRRGSTTRLTTMYQLIKPLLFALPPETAHRLTLAGLDLAARLRLTKVMPAAVQDPVELMGLHFPNRVGLAAGLDKNGEHVRGLAALGFGFIEVGTVTPRAQPGNPQPRLFRLPRAQALINRMGFNNLGLEAMIAQLRQRQFSGVLGVNIGKNFDTPLDSAVDDYLTCLRGVYPYVDYVVVNISSPNTPGLRSLQNRDELTALLATLVAERNRLQQAQQRQVPLLVKIAPDLAEPALREMAQVFLDTAIDGVIATNTTLARTGVEGQSDADQAGGLSGAPLTQAATQVVAILADALAGQLPIIAAGGILSAEDARAKLAAGAALVQLYTGLIYRGPGLVRKVARALRDTH